jgi:hypothetical protein
MKIPRDLCRFTAIATLASAPMTLAIAEPNPTAAGAMAFVNRAEMLKWVADGELGLWIQARDLKWFYARFTGVCQGVSSTNSLIFNTGASGKFDRASSVTVPAGGQCRLRSLVPSGGPPVVFEPFGGWQG